MNNEELFSTLSDIKNLMEKSSRFLSFSGLSAVLVGIYACIAAFIAWWILGSRDPVERPVDWIVEMFSLTINTPYKLRLLFWFAIMLIIICFATVFAMSYYKARKANQPLQWDHTIKRMLWNFFLPLVAGGILCISLLWHQQYGLTSSIMLIFYGLALINASHYTHSTIRYLGYAELLLGLTDSFIEGNALLFWVIGFGFFHIIYGTFFYFKYEKTLFVRDE